VVAGLVPPNERMDQLRELAEQGPPTDSTEAARVAIELSAEFNREEDPLIRAQLVRTLAVFPTREADLLLTDAIEDPTRDVRIAACQAWSTRGGPKAISLLQTQLKQDAEVPVRLAAVEALGNIKDKGAVEPLAIALDDSDPAIQYQAVLALRKLTKQNFQGDVKRWRQYVQGKKPDPRRPISLTNRIQNIF
jgi:HEAT repeat protein